MKSEKDAKSITGQLLEVLEDSRIDLFTIADICDAVAADARFNFWVAGLERDISPDQGFKLLNDYDRSGGDCLAAVANFQRDYDVIKLGQAVRNYTGQLKDFMERKFGQEG